MISSDTPRTIIPPSEQKIREALQLVEGARKSVEHRMREAGIPGSAHVHLDHVIRGAISVHMRIGGGDKLWYSGGKMNTAECYTNWQNVDERIAEAVANRQTKAKRR